jgi:hypothetical protein
VVENRVTIPRDVNIALDHVGTLFQGESDGGERMVGSVRGGAPMRQD